MKNMRSWLSLVALCSSLEAGAQNAPCPSDATLEKLLAFGDLFLGEHHGTVETPHLLQCLVDKALATSSERIIVSLEMPGHAREPDSAFWQQDSWDDGRSSQAMFALVMYLVEKESQALLNLHFQHRTRFNVTGTAYRARTVGNELKALAAQGQLIALAGNAHSMNKLPAIAGYAGTLQEGQYTGSALTHILVTAVNGGSAWACPGACGLMQMAPQAISNDSQPGSLVDGATLGHDYIYYIDEEQFTASPPMDISTPNQQPL